MKICILVFQDIVTLAQCVRSINQSTAKILKLIGSPLTIVTGQHKNVPNQ